MDSLKKAYNDLESQFVFGKNIEYSKLVRANGNDTFPVQRWFHFKESFSIELLQKLILDWKIIVTNDFRILDPYCGVGTTLLAAQKLAHEQNIKTVQAIGIERNPFIHFVAETKTNWHKFDRSVFLEKMDSILKAKALPIPEKRPSLSTLKRPQVFSRHTLNKALSYKQAIAKVPEDERNLLLIGYASILEAISGVRKDGRALRILPGKRRVPIKEAIQKAWGIIHEDLGLAKKKMTPVKTSVFLGDGRNSGGSGFDIGLFDLILYSPPYLNNIDYSEVYKIELWMSGFIKNQADFRDLRLSTFRSHPSVIFPNPIGIATSKPLRKVNAILEQMIDAFPKDSYLHRRKELIYGYFDDMYISLKEQMLHLKPNGWIFCVVGNSLHGPNDNQAQRVPIAADVLIAEIARSIGLKVKSIEVARTLYRRPPETSFMRESIVVLKKED